jgi:hypothetical protein
MSLRGRLIDMRKVYFGVEGIETALANYSFSPSLRGNQLGKA